MLIKLSNLTVKFTQGRFNKRIIYALNNVNLTVERGETVAIIGESGAGKTTLARVLVALEKPTQGEYLYKGKNVWRDRSTRKLIRREVQYIYQDPISALNPSKTIGESLSYPIKKHLKLKGDKLREKIEELLRAVGLDPSLAERYPSQLSGGQLQRVNIARAISINPKVVIADEPVTMLDASYRVGVIDLLANLKKKFDITLILITHDLAIAKYLNYKIEGVRGVVIYGGRIVEEGRINDIISAPLHPYTKYLVNSYIDINSDGKSKIEIREELSTTNVFSPNGCPFSNKCPYVMDKCTKTFPNFSVDRDRKVACYLYGE
ncbi:ABC transporter ATP-binding protein [Stygiolobus azoricus]|uniref:ATP-binding cassette domain-containing protein n=1 Tax=Stygiolobus azoricus TaxID=41675 RepID=A0A650CPH9_9CREN|nr:ABC transporter ATP-binding protein [Stygiolobus azoricus]QGR19615.1 ATP-binding cassette domain-containing protein [Stygiolobus azoricus]